MPTFRIALIAIISSMSTLVLAAGCDAVRTSLELVGHAHGRAARARPHGRRAAAARHAAHAGSGGAACHPADHRRAARHRPPGSGQRRAGRGGTGGPGRAGRPGAPGRQPVRGGHPRLPRLAAVGGDRHQLGRPARLPLRSAAGGTGSGFMIDDQGHILTNNHVVADANRLEITLANGLTLQAELVGRDPRFDLAVIKANIPREQLRVMTLADSEQVQVGEQAIAIGNPYGLEGTVTTGVVSGRRPLVNEPEGDGILVNAIQTDASINPGNSGGPLLNARGEVIGVNTVGRLTPSGAQAGLNFAIPINNAKRILPDLITKGSYAHPFVGIGSSDITPQIASALGLSVQEGLLIQSVEPNSGRGSGRAARRLAAAARDRIAAESCPAAISSSAIDGKPVRRPEEFIAYLELNKKAGENVTLTILRDGQQRDVQVTLGERPPPAARPPR